MTILIYIREAHPIDGWWLDYGVHTNVDEMDNRANDVYAAWPTRLYLVGLDGRVVYAGGLGPYDFKPAKLKAAVDDYLKQMSTNLKPVL